MDDVSHSDVNAHLGDLVERVEAGETIDILRGGKPVARLIAAARPRKRIDVDQLRFATAGMRVQTQDAAALVRSMRDDDRY